MKAIIELGFHCYLLPDVKQATKVVELLAGAIEVSDRLYKGELLVHEKAALISVKVVPENTVFKATTSVNETEAEVQVAPPKPRKTKRQLAFRQQLLLTGTTGEAR